jgi:hypothetical protein
LPVLLEEEKGRLGLLCMFDHILSSIHFHQLVHSHQPLSSATNPSASKFHLLPLGSATVANNRLYAEDTAILELVLEISNPLPRIGEFVAAPTFSEFPEKEKPYYAVSFSFDHEENMTKYYSDISKVVKQLR